MKREYLLSSDARRRLTELGERLVSGPTPDSAALDRVLADLELLPAEAVARAAHEINTEMRLGWYRTPSRLGGVLGLFQRSPRRRRNAN